MTSIPVEGASITQPSTSSISPPAQFAGKVLRAIFLICLIIVTLRVALPQSETIWTIYDEPGDVVRFGLGLGVCVWIGVHLFKLPQGEPSLSNVVAISDWRACHSAFCAPSSCGGTTSTRGGTFCTAERQDFCARRAFVCSSCKPVLTDDLTCLR